MSYETKESAISRTPISLTVIKQDKCANTFSIAPCTATGVQCYNTYKTCVDKPNYVKTTKDYDHVNNDAPRNTTFLELNARPDLLNAEFLGTELREDKTIPARATFTFQDDNDFDQGIDPYRAARTPSLLDVKGSYWKKWIERNPYYKGRILEYRQGYDGLTKADFLLKFSGKMDNITRDGNTVKIECVDDIVDLSNQKYPFKTNKKIAQDIGNCTEVKSQEDMLKLTEVLTDDLALRTDFKYLSSPTTELLYNAGSTLSGTYYYTIVGYDVNDNPYEMTAQETFITDVDYNSVKYTINPDASSYYRIYRTHNDETFYFETSDLIIEDYGQSLFTTAGDLPDKAVRYFKFSSGDPKDLNNWSAVTTPLTILLDSVMDLDTTGYIKIDEEVIYYNGISTLTLQNVDRIKYKTKGSRHYEGTNIKLVTWKAPGNPFTILEDLWLDSGIPSTRIDSATLHALRDAWTGINVSTKPIIKDTDGAKLTADLAWAIDIAYWVNEEGKLTARLNSNETVDHVITDAENIVLESKSIDFSQDEIYTRILLYTNRNDVTKSGKDNYSNIYVEVQADAEGPNMYDKEIPVEQETTWINDDCGSLSAIGTYISNLLNKKIQRMIVTRPKLSFDVELKDSSIQDGQVVQLTSNAFNDIDGNDYTGKKAQVIKKEPKGARIKLLVRLLATESVTTTSEHHIQIFDNPIAVRSFKLSEICVTGLSYIDIDDVRHYSVSGGEVDAENFLNVAWDNMYMSTAETAIDITGVEHSLPRRKIEGPVDTSSWKSVTKYNLYVILLNDGQTQSSAGRPTINDTNGIWCLKAIMNDMKNADPDYVYKIKLMLPAAWLGRKIGYAVYADASLKYDSGGDISDIVKPR